MNLQKSLIVCILAGAPLAVSAQYSGDGIPDRVSVHGSVQADVLFPEDDATIGTEKYSEKILGNFYANAGVYSKYVDGGARIEYLEHPLPGFEKSFKGWGLANIFVKGKYRNMEVTLGDFYEQFGSGFILRTYEERSLGIDNSLRGARLKFNNIKGMRLTALAGIQRCFWNWSLKSKIAGADAEANLETYSSKLRDHNIIWTVGASYVYKHEKDQDIIVPETDLRLNLPLNVSAFDVRTHFNKGEWDILGEYAWKSSDPSADNNYTYAKGNALMLSGSYSKRGLSALIQAKRSENMSFRSRRAQLLTGAFINNMPAFAYQHTYALAAMYPYATQAAPGEWAFQGAFSYQFKRKTALGGKYGTKLKANISYIRGIKREDAVPVHGSIYGTDGGKTKFFGFGDVYYTDLNLQLEKKITSAFHLNAMYMYQRYNQFVIEGHGGMVNAHIGVLEAKYRFDKRFTLRGELQYLGTKQDRKDWCYGLVELSVLPYLMFSVSDMWNCGGDDTHYYMATITGNYRSNRLMVGYGRTKAGYNCSGGVCRYVPASRGFQLSYNYTF
ncbi:MAG: hypothetical protein J6J93_11610 [Muribaculaceae bacterium]|nr:hypothetical protein [Muribaculaceae bacterium]